MSETWLDEKGWDRLAYRLPEGYAWKAQHARKECKKGRAIGGMAIGIRKELAEEAKGKEGRQEEGWITGKVKIGKERWKIGGVYVRKDIERKMEKIKECVEKEGQGRKIIVGGDFNARTGEEGGGYWGERSKEEGGRRSKDKKVNAEGKKLIEGLEEMGWSIMNGNTKGDEEGEITYVGGRGETVIDYAIGDNEVRSRIRGLEIGDKIDSDHHPIIVEVESERWEKTKKKKEQRAAKGDWSRAGRERFRTAIRWDREEEGDINETIAERTGEFKRVIEEEASREGGERKRRRGWWDEEAKEKKARVRTVLRKWRKGGVEVERYRKERGEYNKLCEKKKQEENERFVREAEEANTESKVWEVINRERVRRKKASEKIEKQEWKEYFMKLLGGVETRAEGRENEVRGEDAEREIGREEIRKAIAKLKDGKSPGGDNIENEVWRYGGEGVVGWVEKVCNRVWKGEGWPEVWKEGWIVPIVKSGNGKKVEEYRGVTLMPTLYKIYAAVLAGRLEEEMERKNMIPQNQTGFRKGRGTVDNIYVLNHLINKNVNRKKGGMVVLFIDLKAAFDSVNREVLWEAMEERGVREELISRVREVYSETKNRVKIGGEVTEVFWTVKGVRQGCPLSSFLFNLLTADLEEEMSKEGGVGGVLLGGRKVYTLAYADDIAMVAAKEEGMKAMIRRLERYLSKKDLVLNVNKTKVMRCRRGGGRFKNEEWKWKGEKIEEVKEFKYLGYVVMRNGGQDAHVRDRVKKAGVVMRQVWGIGKRRFGKNWERRMWMFDRLVWTVVEYAAEIWGWREWKAVEALQERYIRWILGVDWRTPGYIVREELMRLKLRTRAGKRAWSFEKRLEEGRGSELARVCWREIKDRMEREGSASGWEKDRKERVREWTRERGERGERREGEEGIGLEYETIEAADRQKQAEERWEKISNSRYNKWYREIKREGIPEYLRKGWGEGRWKRVARFRLGGEVRAAKYWESTEEKICRLCRIEEETWEHVWEGCAGGAERNESWQIVVRQMLGEEGEGEEWMREVERARAEEGNDGRNEWETEVDRAE